MTTCPECGAAECEARFHEFLALEFAHPDYAAVHHLTVAAYMLQHSTRLTRAGWLLERQLLEDFLDHAATPVQVRTRFRRALAGGRRAFRIKSADHKPLYNGILWGRTIQDVRSAPAQAYREDIAAWARQTLRDSQHIVVERHET